METPDGKQLTPVPGASRINVRDVPHGAFKVIGDKAFKLLAVLRTALSAEPNMYLFDSANQPDRA